MDVQLFNFMCISGIMPDIMSKIRNKRKILSKKDALNGVSFSYDILINYDSLQDFSVKLASMFIGNNSLFLKYTRGILYNIIIKIGLGFGTPEEARYRFSKKQINLRIVPYNLPISRARPTLDGTYRIGQYVVGVLMITSIPNFHQKVSAYMFKCSDSLCTFISYKRGNSDVKTTACPICGRSLIADPSGDITINSMLISCYTKGSSLPSIDLDVNLDRSEKPSLSIGSSISFVGIFGLTYTLKPIIHVSNWELIDPISTSDGTLVESDPNSDPCADIFRSISTISPSDEGSSKRLSFLTAVAVTVQKSLIVQTDDYHSHDMAVDVISATLKRNGIGAFKVMSKWPFSEVEVGHFLSQGVGIVSHAETITGRSRDRLLQAAASSSPKGSLICVCCGSGELNDSCADFGLSTKVRFERRLRVPASPRSQLFAAARAAYKRGTEADEGASRLLVAYASRSERGDRALDVAAAVSCLRGSPSIAAEDAAMAICLCEGGAGRRTSLSASPGKGAAFFGGDGAVDSASEVHSFMVYARRLTRLLDGAY